MKKVMTFALLSLLAFGVTGKNLLENGSYDKPLTKETRWRNNTGWSLLKIFTEDTTWNKAARLTVTQVYQKGDRKVFLAWFFIGGDGSKMNSTIKIKPKTTYRYYFTEHF